MQPEKYRLTVKNADLKCTTALRVYESSTSGQLARETMTGHVSVMLLWKDSKYKVLSIIQKWSLTAIVKKREPHYPFLSNSWANPVARFAGPALSQLDTLFPALSKYCLRGQVPKSFCLSQAEDLFLCGFPCVNFYLTLHMVSLSPTERATRTLVL